jgi:hypothetical protein
MRPFDRNRFTVVPVSGDGDCFYNAFIHGLGLTGKVRPHQLRAVVASRLLEDPDLRDDLIREWRDFGIVTGKVFSDTGKQIRSADIVDRVCNRADWATSTVIHILAIAFSRPVRIAEKINGHWFVQSFPSPWKVKRGDLLREKKPPVYILKTKNHFDALVRQPKSDVSMAARKAITIVGSFFITILVSWIVVNYR